MKGTILCMAVATILLLSLERRLDLVIMFDGWVYVKEESWVIRHGVGPIVLLCVYACLSSRH